MPISDKKGASTLILGAGITGLAAGIASGGTVLEQRSVAGGICSSYYCTPHSGFYRFEYGGGHWIFGGDQEVLRWIAQRSPCNQYRRHAAVFFPNKNLYVPYPLQNHLAHLGEAMAECVLEEIQGLSYESSPETMRDWLLQSFGPSLCELFFFPFHDAYTAGLYGKIGPQDAQKSPVNIDAVREGAVGISEPAGYNITFLYPDRGLDHLVAQMAKDCVVHLGCEVTAIHPERRLVSLSSGKNVSYARLISTLPLHTTIEMAGLKVDSPADPYTSVLVLNIGGTAGPYCPKHHWLYIPHSEAGFHRVGFYSNVESTFAPSTSTGRRYISIYIEKAFLGGEVLNDAEVEGYKVSVIAELQQWGFLEEVDIIDPTWVPVAYTWSWPGSIWREQAIAALERDGIEPVGRYARWSFQGIAASIRDGLAI